MGFKDLIQKDIRTVFFNPKEFGTPHTVNEKEMCIIVDDNEMIEREKRYSMREMVDGTFKRKILFYVAAAEFGPLPMVGRMLSLDRRSYKITDAVNEDGIYSISLEAVKAT